MMSKIGIKTTTLYKFRALKTCTDLERIEDIIENGFYCNDFLNFNDMNEGVYRPTNKNDLTLEGKLEYKICSFSGEEALSSELMWGHYGNAGMGIIIEIKNGKNHPDVKQVIYLDETLKSNSLEEILTHKKLVWSYECEYRYISNALIEKIKIGEIEKIYYGTPYKHLSNYKEIYNKHEDLQKYCKRIDQLKIICKKNNIKLEEFSEYKPDNLLNASKCLSNPSFFTSDRE
jgi:hypothetical protein